MGKTNLNLFYDFKEIVGKRHKSPIKNLMQKIFREVKSPFGNVDEFHYTCKSCTTTWSSEIGAYGERWT